MLSSAWPQLAQSPSILIDGPIDGDDDEPAGRADLDDALCFGAFGGAASDDKLGIAGRLVALALDDAPVRMTASRSWIESWSSSSSTAMGGDNIVEIAHEAANISDRRPRHQPSPAA
jgi:hypothetical protein